MNAWIVSPTRDGKPSNNYVRQRAHTLKSFIEWLIDRGELPPEAHKLIDWKHYRNEYPRLYGAKQSKNGAHFLNHEQAYVQLLGACQDGTWTGSRDQLAIRFGLLGLRHAEILRLSWSNYDGTVVRIIGKRNRLREVRPGPKMQDMLARWRLHLETQLGRPVLGTDPILVAKQQGNVPGFNRPDFTRELDYTRRLSKCGLEALLRHRSELAGFAFTLKPHDLRRSTANILHNAKTTDGAHLYDLLDIQRVMDHASPDVTQRSYIDHLDNTVKTRAGEYLD